MIAKPLKVAAPPAPVVALLAALCGVCVAGMVPASNGLFVQALPRQYRARAFGVMQSGLQILQGGAIMLTGLLAAHYSLPRVVGLWSLAGFLLMLAVSVRWPAPEEFAVTIKRNQEANAAAEAAEAAVTGPGTGSTSGIPVPPPGVSPENNGGAHTRSKMRTAESS